MARMYPERLPRILTDDPMRAAEARVYSRLGDSLDDGFTVMHGVPYLVEGEGGHRHDGEVDFLVGHADLGLLVLEVKAGASRTTGSPGGGRAGTGPAPSTRSRTRSTRRAGTSTTCCAG